MTRHTYSPHGFGYSHTGHEHTAHDLPNQDSWGLRHYRAGTLAVVCDGLGSKTHSDVGSLQAVIAAREAFRGWSQTPNAPARGFVALLNTLWNIRTHAHVRNECATTCLVALWLPERLITAQLGDGLIAILNEEERVEYLTSSSSDFANETLSLGSNVSLDDWTILERDALTPREQLLLCTDGISEVIAADKLSGFMTWLRTLHTENSGSGRHAKLKRSFAKLPAMKRADDATLVTLWSNET
tara:strand:- start:584 stop:1309 length:726 start_codon:yes stop_codon:yes gene_type:complete